MSVTVATAKPDEAGTAAVASRTIMAIKGHLAHHFGDVAWREDESGRSHGLFGERDPGSGHPIADRARSLITAIRFNDW